MSPCIVRVPMCINTEGCTPAAALEEVGKLTAEHMCSHLQGQAGF